MKAWTAVVPRLQRLWLALPTPGQVFGRALLLLLLMFCGAVVGFFGSRGWLMVMLPCGLFVALMLGRVWRISPAKTLFGLVLLLYLLLPLLYKATGINWMNRWQFLVLGLALFGLPGLLREAGRNRGLAAALLCWLGFLVLVGLSTAVAGRSQPLAAAWQVFSDLKPVWLLGLGFALWRAPSAHQLVWQLARWAWLPLLLLVVLQWSAPSLYMRLFAFQLTPGPDAGGLLPSQAFGMFEHPAMLAAFAGPMALLTGLQAVNGGGRRAWALAAVYLLLLGVSGERGELGALLLAFGAVHLWNRPNRLLARLALALPLLALLLALYWLLYGQTLSQEAALWGASRTAAVEHPRAQLYEGAVYLANQNFPLGNGLGTYGGAGAAKYDLTTYIRLGFARFWWFRDENYLLDIYWHNALGEGGWAALLLQLLHYVLLAWMALRRYRDSLGLERIYWGGAGFGLIYMLVNSVASPGFQDPRLYVWTALCLGLAVQQRKEERR